MASAFDFHGYMKEQGILFAYAGELSPDIITSLLHMLDNKLKLRGLGVRRKKNLMNIAIECLQNIHYHGYRPEEGRQDTVNCHMAIQQQDNLYSLHFSNEILAAEVPGLSERLFYLNSLDTDALHREYLDVLNRGIMTAKGGGGLGLIRILRESGRPMTYTFEPTDTPELLTMNLVVSLLIEKAAIPTI